MSRTRTGRAILALMLAASSVSYSREAPDPVPPVEPEWSIERTKWFGEAGPGQNLVVHNAFGDLRLRFGGYEGRVEVLATLQRFPQEGSHLEVLAEESEDGIRVMTGYRQAGSGGFVAERGKGGRRRADLVIFVPEDLAVDVSTDHGLVEIKGIHGDVVAQTVSGEMIVRSVTGNLDLTADTGSILVSLSTHESERRHVLRSSSGDLTAVFWGDASFTVDLRTQGRISTDFTMEIDPVSAEPSIKQGVAVVGKGAGELRMESDRGHIRLQRRPLARKARAGGVN